MVKITAAEDPQSEKTSLMKTGYWSLTESAGQ
jgi:hypothetical protein